MEAASRDDTQDWLLAEEAKPPLFGELVERIEEALAIARASESSVESIGAVAIESAEKAQRALEQATQAAEHARRSAELAAGVRGIPTATDLSPEADLAPAADMAPATRAQTNGPAPLQDASLRRFSDRADRLGARLRALQRIPLAGEESADVL